MGADCLYDEDCLTRNSFCKGNKICACKLGYKYDAGSDICFPKGNSLLFFFNFVLKSNAYVKALQMLRTEIQFFYTEHQVGLNVDRTI